MNKNNIINKVKLKLKNEQFFETVFFSSIFCIGWSISAYCLSGPIEPKIWVSIIAVPLVFYYFYALTHAPNQKSPKEKKEDLLFQFIKDMSQDNIGKVLFYFDSEDSQEKAIIQDKNRQNLYELEYSFNELKGLLKQNNVKIYNESKQNDFYNENIN